jgi:hypothetical protein
VVICVMEPCRLENGLHIFQDPSISIKRSRPSGRVRCFSGDYTIVSRDMLYGLSSRLTAEPSDATACPRIFYGTRRIFEEMKSTVVLEYFKELDGSSKR